MDREFYSWLTAKGYAANTCKDSAHRLDFLRRVIVPFNTAGFHNFLVATRDKYTNNTFNAYIKILKRYQSYKGCSCFNGLKTIPKNTSCRSTMTTDELCRFLAVVEPHSATRKYNYGLFWRLIAYTGSRMGEVANLKAADVSFAEGVLYFNQTKTGSRKVPIPSLCLTELTEHCNSHPDYLFPKMNPVYWNVNFHYRLRICKINRPIVPYSLRHTAITTYLQTPGVNLYDVQALVGHKNAATTQIYYHSCMERLKQVVQKHPLITQTTTVEEKVRYICDLIRGLGIEYEPNVKMKGKSAEVSLVIRPPPCRGRPRSVKL
jgi:integrase